MENNKLSFLFFLWVLCLIAWQDALAQQVVDSTTLNYYKIVTPQTSEDLPSGYAYFNKYKDAQLLKKDTVGAIYALRMITMAEYDMGRVNASENSAIEALSLYDLASEEIKKEAIAESGLYNLLGMVYYAKDQPEKAIENYAIALKKTTKLSDSLTLLNNMANAYGKLKNYKKAISLLEWGYNTSRQQDNTEAIARALDNLGYIQSEAGKAEGISNMLQALEIRKELADHGQLFTSYKHLSEYYKNAGDLVTARNYAILGKEAASQVSVGYKKVALEQYLALSEDADVVELININDSISKATLEQDKKFASIEYNFAKEKERTQVAELAQEKERRQKSIYQVLGLCIGLLTIGLYFVLRFRHKKEKTEQLYQTESRISKKIHDEVANELYGIMAKIQTSPNTDEVLLDDLESIYNKTRDISKENSLIQIDADFGQVLIGLLQNYQNDNVNVITKNITAVNWASMDDHKKITLYRVLQELMTNMRKHSKATLVVITANQSGKKLGFTYTDNGVGGELKKGNGLLNTENRIQSIAGTIIFDTTINRGFTAKISL